MFKNIIVFLGGVYVGSRYHKELNPYVRYIESEVIRNISKMKEIDDKINKEYGSKKA